MPVPLLIALLLVAVPHPAMSAPEAGSPKLDMGSSRFDPPPEHEDLGRVTLLFTGDTKLCGRTAQQMARHGPEYPFASVAEVMHSADICFGNLETAITSHSVPTPGKPTESIRAGRNFVFRCDPATSGSILSAAGFDILQLANNHAMDYGHQGLHDTLACLDTAGIAHVGAGPDYAAACAAWMLERNGVRIGFLAYSLIVPAQSAARAASPGINTLPVNYTAHLRDVVSELRTRADFVIIGFHWGIEGATAPNHQQRSVGRAAIDAGADLVIGTHTHTLQGVEQYRGGVIAYSLGNFVFTGASRRLVGGILRVTLEHDGSSVQIAETALLPCWINDGVPTPSTDAGLRSRVADVMRVTGSRPTVGKQGWLALEPLR